MAFVFKWDSAKAKSNLQKHGVDFETASSVFLDPFVMTEQDRIEGGEYRWQTLGMVNGHLILLVAHTVCEEIDDIGIYRLISARPANKKERKRYERNRIL
jgi:uncharacterized DUF497 family protein